MLVSARAPMIHAGSGVVHAGAFAELAAVAEALHAPVTTSWGARAALDERQSYAVPMIYVDLVTRVRRESDVVLALGSRIGETDWWGKPPYWASPAEQRMIQVDIDEETIGNNKPADLVVIADARLFLRKLHGAVLARRNLIDIAARRARLARIRDERARARAAFDAKLADRGAPMCSAHVGAACRRVFADDAIAVFDGGNACIWGNFYHEVRTPGAVLGTPKFGMLGAGLAQAIGAKIAFPERQVYCITGDGAFGFHPQEIETCVRHRLAIVTLILCDGQWGMVKMNQSFQLRPLKTLLMGALSPGENIAADFAEVRWDAVARAMGAHGERVAHPDELEPAIRRSLAQAGPSVIHVDVDPVKHMWAPALKSFKDMHAEPCGR
jgi:acetolactate synthase-1/2/3 large subunit